MNREKRTVSQVRKVTRRDFLKTTGLGAAGTLLAACVPVATPTKAPEAKPTTPPPAEAPTPTSAPALAKAQEVRFLVVEDFFGDMNPYSNWITASARVSNHIYDCLVKWDDKQENIIPDLAESWELQDDNTWVFRLRPGIKFHDGTEFTADSVKYSLEEVQEGERGFAFSSLFTVPMEITVVDKHTAKVATESPYSALLPNLTIVGMLNPTQSKEEIDKAPVGTGLFKFVSREGNTIELEANENCWQGKPQLSRITFEAVKDLTTRIAALRGGQVQIVERIPPDRIEEVQEDPTVKVIIAPTNETVRWEARGAGPMGDNNFRLALWHAVDRQGLIDAFLQGQYEVATAPCAKAVFGYPPDLPPINYDPEKAKSLLAKSKYDGSELEFMTTPGFHVRSEEIIVAVADMVKPVGINLKPAVEELGRLYEKAMDPEYNGLMYLGWVSWTGDSDFVIGFLWYKGHGMIKYDNPKVNKLFDESRAAMDWAERKAKLQETYRALWDDSWTLWFYETVQAVGMAKNLENWPVPPTMLHVATPDTYLA